MAHAFSNIGFETAGALAGYALAWTVVVVATAEEYAGYDTTLTQAYEDFEEEWASGNQDTYWTLASSTAAAYDTTPAEAYEDFEEEWDNEPHSTELPATATASYDSTPEDFEDFEESWDSNEDGVFTFDGGDTTAASYDTGAPETKEDFEEEWQDNEDSIFEFDGGDVLAGSFDGESVEDFEEVDLRMQTVAVTAIGADADTLTVIVNGVPVTRVCTGVGTLDTERDFLIDGINAAVLGADASADGTGEIKLRSTNSGDPLSIKVESTGTLAKIELLPPPDKTLYWTQTGELA